MYEENGQAVLVVDEQQISPEGFDILLHFLHTGCAFEEIDEAASADVNRKLIKVSAVMDTQVETYVACSKLSRQPSFSNVRN